MVWHFCRIFSTNMAYILIIWSLLPISYASDANITIFRLKLHIFSYCWLCILFKHFHFYCISLWDWKYLFVLIWKMDFEWQHYLCKRRQDLKLCLARSQRWCIVCWKTDDLHVVTETVWLWSDVSQPWAENWDIQHCLRQLVKIAWVSDLNVPV